MDRYVYVLMLKNLTILINFRIINEKSISTMKTVFFIHII